MSIRGTRPTPTALRSLHGNPSRTSRAILNKEPIAVGELGDPPEWFSDKQREGWDWALTNSPPGMLRLVDRGALITWVIAEDLHRQACIEQNKVGLLIKTVTGALVQSPFLPVINKQALIMLRSAGDLGFTPVSRPRIADRPGSLSNVASEAPTMAPMPGRKKGGRQEVVVSIEEFLRAAPTG